MAMCLNEVSSNGFAITQSGSIWYMDWDESTTLKINSFHQE